VLKNFKETYMLIMVVKEAKALILALFEKRGGDAV